MSIGCLVTALSKGVAHVVDWIGTEAGCLLGIVLLVMAAQGLSRV